MANRQPRLSERAKFVSGADRRYYYRHPCGCVQEFAGINQTSLSHVAPPDGAKVVVLTEDHMPRWVGHVCTAGDAS